MRYRIIFGIGKIKDLEIVQEFSSFENACNKAEKIAKERAILTQSVPATLNNGFTVEELETEK